MALLAVSAGLLTLEAALPWRVALVAGLWAALAGFQQVRHLPA